MSFAPPPPEADDEVKFVMCPPTYLSNKIPNNTFMDKSEPIDKDRAMKQWMRMVNVFRSWDIDIEIISPVKGAQDQTFVANVAVAIKPYIVLANYKAPGRPIEVAPARKFFTNLGYKCIQPPFHFEGEAELKKLNDTTYFGGYGQFTDIRALQWIEKQTGIKIIPLKETDKELYHEDTFLMVLDEENVMVTKKGTDQKSYDLIKKYANVIDTPADIPTTGITNGVLIPEKKIYCSGTFQPEERDYRKAMEWLMETMDKFGYTCVFLDTDATGPSGADLSCQVMHLNF